MGGKDNCASGVKTVSVRLTPEDIAAADAEVARRARAGLMYRPDRSCLIREAIRSQSWFPDGAGDPR